MLYSEVILPVRYYETDQMGVVHHSNYIRYFECARNHMMQQGGYPIESCEDDGVVIPVVEVDCKFHFPARMGDVLTVSAMIDKVPLAKLRIRHEARNQDGVLCADGFVSLGFLDKASGRPVPCPERIASMIEKALKEGVSTV